MIRILSIDGGGIRGVLPGQILVSLEKKLKEKSGDEDASIAEYFDLIAGTSTGGILTCALLAPSIIDPSKARYSAQEAVNLYLDKGDEIFKRTTLKNIQSMNGLRDELYDEKNIEKILDDTFDDLKLSELLKPCLITSYDIERRGAHFFTQHDAAKQPGYDFLVKEVARSTSAAPTYFEANMAPSLSGVKYPLIDGGVFVNNPTLCAYAEARTLFNKPGTDKKVTASDLFILSLGTGSGTKKSYPYNKAKNWGKIEWIAPLIDIMMSGVAETVDFQLGQIYDAVDCEDQYIRIQPELFHADNEMDNAEEENLNRLKQDGIQNAEKMDAELDRVASVLVSSQESSEDPVSGTPVA